MTNTEGPDPIDRRLRDALRATAQADAELGASPTVRARLLALVHARRKPRRRIETTWIAAAAAIVIAGTAARWGVTHTARSPEALTTVATGTAWPDAAPTDFLPLRYVKVPARCGHIVLMLVPASVMPSFGLDPPASPGGVVTADVFIGDDGLARAVRFDSSITREQSQ
jgi:hypothetical protein